MSRKGMAVSSPKKTAQSKSTDLTVVHSDQGSMSTERSSSEEGGTNEILKYLRVAHQVEDDAFKNCDTELLHLVHKFVSGLVQIRELFDAFQNSPGARIEGARGVAKQLGISRNAVYLRLEWVGLRPDHFREPKINLVQLIKASKTVRPLLDNLMKREEKGEIA